MDRNCYSAPRVPRCQDGDRSIGPSAVGLVEAADIEMLTAPLVEGAALADRDTIGKRLRAIYASGNSIDRFFFTSPVTGSLRIRIRPTT